MTVDDIIHEIRNLHADEIPDLFYRLHEEARLLLGDRFEGFFADEPKEEIPGQTSAENATSLRVQNGVTEATVRRIIDYRKKGWNWPKFDKKFKKSDGWAKRLLKRLGHWPIS